jgi:hypothetical protein
MRAIGETPCGSSGLCFIALFSGQRLCNQKAPARNRGRSGAPDASWVQYTLLFYERIQSSIPWEQSGIVDASGALEKRSPLSLADANGWRKGRPRDSAHAGKLAHRPISGYKVRQRILTLLRHSAYGSGHGCFLHSFANGHKLKTICPVCSVKCPPGSYRNLWHD